MVTLLVAAGVLVLGDLTPTLGDLPTALRGVLEVGWLWAAATGCPPLRLSSAVSKFHANSVEAAPHLLQRTCPSSAPYPHAAAVFEGFLVGDLRDVVREVREAGAIARLNPVQVGSCCCCNICPPQVAAGCSGFWLLLAALAASHEWLLLEWMNSTLYRRCPYIHITYLPPLPPAPPAVRHLCAVAGPAPRAVPVHPAPVCAGGGAGREWEGDGWDGISWMCTGGRPCVGWVPARKAAWLVQAPTQL